METIFQNSERNLQRLVLNEIGPESTAAELESVVRYFENGIYRQSVDSDAVRAVMA